MKGLIWLCVFLAWNSSVIHGQQRLSPPIRHAMVMTGSFGELRPDHFHAGIDLRSTTGQPGDPILAAASGYVSRVMVQHEGYGNALFIRHSDGRTTLYAHLHAFAPEIQAWVDTIRYAWQKEELDLVLGSQTFPVNTGQRIGLMGTTGRSTGVHLHFEYREKEGYFALDPGYFGIKLADQAPPIITGLKLYALDDKLLPLFDQKVPVLKRGSHYKVKGDTLVVGAWRVGLGIAAHDLIEQTKFKTGISAIDIFVDEEPVYSFKVDKLDLRQARYVNAHLDYGEWINNKERYHRCYPLQGNRMSLYPVMRKAGMITLSRWDKRKVRVAVTDKAGRTSEVIFWIRRDDQMIAPSPRLYQFKIPFGEAFVREDDDMQWSIPSGSFYETTFLEYARLESSDNTVQFQLHQATTPLHQFMDISFRLPDSLLAFRQQMAIVYKEGEQWVSCGGIFDEDRLYAQSRHLGTYTWYRDSLPPIIVPIKVMAEYNNKDKFRIHISDNLRVAAHLKPFSWQITLNDQWLPGEWHYGTQELHIDPARALAKGENVLKVGVADERGNAALFEHRFTW